MKNELICFFQTLRYRKKNECENISHFENSLTFLAVNKTDK